MKTMVMANQKGGVGKTANLVHLAFDFLERGLSVCVVDLDTQANASWTLKDYSSGYTASQLFDQSSEDIREWFDDGVVSGPCIKLIESDALLTNLTAFKPGDVSRIFRENVSALSEHGFDVLLIDTAPSLGHGMTAALVAADFVLSPIEPELYAVTGIKQMITTIANIRQNNDPSLRNERLQFIGMVPSKIDRRSPRHTQNLAELDTRFPKMVAPISVGLRSSIAEAVAYGVPVWKIQKTAARKAAKEVRALADYVFNKMEIA